MDYRNDYLALAERIRMVRIEHWGVEGKAGLATQLGIPCQTWGNYEAGITIPALVLLKFIGLTGVCPGWLLDGQSPKYTSHIVRR